MGWRISFGGRARLEGLFKVMYDVFNVLNANGNSNEVLIVKLVRWRPD